MPNTKQEALNLFEEKRAEFLALCRWEAKRLAQQNGGWVNIDQVRDQIICPEGVNPKVYGAVFSNGEFERGSFIITKRKSSHGRPISTWYWKAYKPITKRQIETEGNLSLGI